MHVFINYNREFISVNCKEHLHSKSTSFIPAFFFSLFLQDRLIGMIGLRGTYILGLVIFSLSMVFTVLASTNVTILNICALFSGLGFSVITTIPNSLITMYHAEPEVYLRRGRKTGFGSDIAILDSG